ncbi:hypothetical protein Celal_4174 [Cellulophaga algicola DSM 14237]|uniref:Uncharacterized protein n=1 Tax=Cellulophaga algicola (strain DSM 14237 / IC166 / ACAM 630) TaxID=688270 RepID=E6XFE3_CELAD|nr:hypothetical protein Celal_4174 [Cellulophaga algicola DSM 14237]
MCILFALIIYSYLLIPDVKVFNLFFWKFSMDESIDLNFIIYCKKTYVIAFVSVWFLTISDRWKYCLAPLLVYMCFRISEVVIVELNLNFNSYIFGIMVGLLYCFLLNQFDKKFEFNTVEKIKILVFDITNLFYLSYVERKFFINKRDLFTSKKIIKRKVI